MKVRYTQRASRELIAILLYLSKNSPQGLRNVQRAIEKAERLIGLFPQCGRRTRIKGTRMLPAGRYPYLIYWIVEERPGQDRSHPRRAAQTVARRVIVRAKRSR
jgi:toxin ParE1/3/4